jgi:murein L,D-transpeptidase YcbB/YkuD
MDMVTFHPRWNVPDSIKVRELYPSLARGGTYFEKQGLRMSRNGKPVDPYYVDWGSADIRQFDVQQPPGPANVLGKFKFTFHNKHIVYMHDTPTKNLFDKPSRPFSHGCMRVRNPQRFAELVLAADKGWTPEQVAEIASGPAVASPISPSASATTARCCASRTCMATRNAWCWRSKGGSRTSSWAPTTWRR